MTTENRYVAPPSQAPGTNVLAIISLITGILGFNIIAMVLGFVALSMIKKSGESGRGLAIAGIILGGIGIIVFIIVIIAVVIVGAASAAYSY